MHGDFEVLLPNDERVYAFTRRLGDVALLVLGNFSGETVTADFPDAEAWSRSERLLGNWPEPAGPALRPWEARIHRRVD